MKQYILVTLSVLWVGMAWAGFKVPAKPNAMVYDEANVFSSREAQALNNELQAFSDTSSNQIVVVTLNDLQGYEPFEVATEIGQTWGVGQDGFDNGIIILIKPKTAASKGQVFIAQGYGLEGAIPDAATKMIVEQEFIPMFKRQEMYAGVYNGIQVLKALAVNEYNFETYKKGGNGGSPVFPILLLLAVFGFAMFRRVNDARAYGVGNNVSFWTALWLMNQSRGHGGYYNNFTSGGGGFGGFGGGGFGGGGAGGSW